MSRLRPSSLSVEIESNRANFIIPHYIYRMPQKTKRETRRRRRRRTQRRSSLSNSSSPKEHHHFYSKMVFDGKNVITESQKDHEPVQRRIYTMKQLEREIPIGAELLKKGNIHKVPKALQYPIPKEIRFRSVLPNPADLGLLPPTMTRRASHRRFGDSDGHSNNINNMELIVQEKDNHNGPSRKLFDIPV